MARKQNAIWFHGGGSLIAQEVAMIELLEQHKGLTITQDNTFLIGFSTGALMSFAINAAYSDPVAYSWEQFKALLFNLENEMIYGPNPDGGLFPLDSQPLRELLTTLIGDTGYTHLSNLPFGTALLTASKLADDQHLKEISTYWINNVTALEPQGDIPDAEQIRAHQPQLNLVDILMDSTAIDIVFPAQTLSYTDDSDAQQYITQGTEMEGEPALYLDGGTYGTFAGFEHFCGNYEDTFENLYIICPDFTTRSQSLLGKLWDSFAEKVSFLDLIGDIDLPRGVEKFIQDLMLYNDEHKLADNIYVSAPEIVGGEDGAFSQLDFTRMEEQYDLTMQWGAENPDSIALDVYTLD